MMSTCKRQALVHPVGQGKPCDVACVGTAGGGVWEAEGRAVPLQQGAGGAMDVVTAVDVRSVT